VITSGGGNDTIQGGDGNDNITSGAGNDSVSGDAGNDTISTGDGADTVDGAVGSDNINTGAGDDRITIAAWADITVADTINGGDGTDTIVAAAGAVTLNSAATGGLQNLEAVALAEAAGQTVRSPMPALVRSTTPSPSRLSRLRPTSSTPAACCPPRHA
jgi:Ca2+-binding RTX toxin-like protein